MDHAINSLKVYYEITLDQLNEEWNSGKYKVLSDCPSFHECNTYRKALDVLYEGYLRKDITSSVEDDLNHYLDLNR